MRTNQTKEEWCGVRWRRKRKRRRKKKRIVNWASAKGHEGQNAWQKYKGPRNLSDDNEAVVF